MSAAPKAHEARHGCWCSYPHRTNADHAECWRTFVGEAEAYAQEHGLRRHPRETKHSFLRRVVLDARPRFDAKAHDVKRAAWLLTRIRVGMTVALLALVALLPGCATDCTDPANYEAISETPRLSLETALESCAAFETEEKRDRCVRNLGWGCE